MNVCILSLFQSVYLCYFPGFKCIQDFDPPTYRGYWYAPYYDSLFDLSLHFDKVGSYWVVKLASRAHMPIFRMLFLGVPTIVMM